MITYLDLQANPAASAIIMVNDYVEVLWHLAGNAPILDVNAPQRHGRHLVESQRLHMQGQWLSRITHACEAPGSLVACNGC